MNLASNLTDMDRASRRLARLPLAIRRLSAQELGTLLGAYGPWKQTASAAAELRHGWVNDPVLLDQYNPKVVAAQEQINRLVLEDEGFRRKMDTAVPGLSEDYIAFVLYAIADALVYDKSDSTGVLIQTIYGPLEQFCSWEELGHTKPPAWYSPSAV